MKRIGNIYERIYDIENIKLAIIKASNGKRTHKHVAPILESPNYYAGKVQKLLMDKTYIPAKPKIKTIQDASSGKIREIFKPNFYPDQIIHWALMLQLEPIIMKGMYEYTCGSVPNRGTSYGQKMIRLWLDNDRKHTKYCLKMDVTKFYPSIDNELLKKAFRRKIKDKDCLWLIDSIIDINQGQPIGFFTSQWFANFFLEGLDHYIKEELGIKYYVRYVDDLVMFGNNKKKLHKARKAIIEYCDSLKLNIKESWQVFRVDKRDVDFLGMRFYRNRTTLRSRNSLRIRRRAVKISKKGYLNEKDASAIISYWGWMKRSDSYGYYHKYIKPHVTIKQARKVVSVNAKIRANNERGVTPQRPYAPRIQASSVRKGANRL